jgi:hypothetical protein
MLSKIKRKKTSELIESRRRKAGRVILDSDSDSVEDDGTT